MRPGAWLLTGPETIETCRGCSTVLVRSYWRVDGSAHCGPCAEALRRNESAYLRRCRMRGLLFGVAAALLSFIPISWSIDLLRHIPESALPIWDLGLWAFTALILLLGALLGAAVSAGSHQRGGLVLQIAAATLTYLTYTEALAAETLVSLSLHAGRGPMLALPVRTLLRLAAFAPAAPMLALRRSLFALPGLVSVAFAMLLAWQLNPEGRRLAVSGPFEYTRRSAAKRSTRRWS